MSKLKQQLVFLSLVLLTSSGYFYVSVKLTASAIQKDIAYDLFPKVLTSNISHIDVTNNQPMELLFHRVTETDLHQKVEFKVKATLSFQNIRFELVEAPYFIKGMDVSFSQEGSITKWKCDKGTLVKYFGINPCRKQDVYNVSRIQKQG